MKKLTVIPELLPSSNTINIGTFEEKSMQSKTNKTRFRVSRHVSERGPYGGFKVNVIDLNIAISYRMFGKLRIAWVRALSIDEHDLPSMIKSDTELLEIMVDLWREERAKTLPERRKNKVIKNLMYR